MREAAIKEQKAYQRRLEYYRTSLKDNHIHMRTVDVCMKNYYKNYRKNAEGHQKVREEVFVHVWLPVIMEYVEWVLDEAIMSGKKRLYFLARDGYMMYLMAEKLVRARKLKIELRYLKVSRFAIRNAEYFFIGKDALDTLCVGGIDITFEKIMKRANLTEEEALHIARLAGRTENYKTPLNYRQLRKLKEDLSRIEQLFIYIKEHSQRCYETTAAYLRQEGLLEPISYALVDSGWVGSLQLSLQRVLAHEASRDIRLQGYYFGIYERPKGTDAEQYKAFYFGEKDVWRKVRFSNCLFETVLSAPEGMTCGYEMMLDGMVMSELMPDKTIPCNIVPDGTIHNEKIHSKIHSRSSVYIALESDVKNPNAEIIERFSELLSEYVSAYIEATYVAPTTYITSTECAESAANVTSAAAMNPSEVLKPSVSTDTQADDLTTIHRIHANSIRFVASLLDPMMGNPTKQEAKAFGELLFCDDVLELNLQPVAAEWDEEQLRENRFLYKVLSKLNLKPAGLNESAWPEGSIARLGIKTEMNMRQERLYKSLMYIRKAVCK